MSITFVSYITALLGSRLSLFLTTFALIPFLYLLGIMISVARMPRILQAGDGVNAGLLPTQKHAISRGKKVNGSRMAAPTLQPYHPQPYDAFLVLDVEATCLQGTGLNWPNEIIEFPVCLMKWKDMSQESNETNHLEVVDEFRSFVKPIWRPRLSDFCSSLTGITQSQVEHAPHFPEVLQKFSKFLVKNGLIDSTSGERRARFCWCSDGPFDVRDFVVKQCFISQIRMPEWIRGDVLDVRMQVRIWYASQHPRRPSSSRRCPSMNISGQLHVLGLADFEGRQHSGIDDTRNIARILSELARRGVPLRPNTSIDPCRRWAWMGKSGQIMQEYCHI